jgi:heme-degrading monooxygenase HmoA
MPITIETGGPGLTVVVTYVCAEEKQDELVDAIEKAITEVYAEQPGFVSGSVHASLDHTRVLTYAQWERVEDFDAGGRVPAVQERNAQILELVESADPRLYQVRWVHPDEH